jgi:hypothetical protein
MKINKKFVLGLVITIIIAVGFMIPSVHIIRNSGWSAFLIYLVLRNITLLEEWVTKQLLAKLNSKEG